MGDQQVVGNGSHAQALCAGGARGNGGSGDLAQLPKESAGAADRQRDDHRLLPLRALPLRRYHLHQRMQAYSWRFRAPAADGGRGEAGASCRSGGRLFGGGERGKHGKKAIGWEEGGNGWVRSQAEDYLWAQHKHPLVGGARQQAAALLALRCPPSRHAGRFLEKSELLVAVVEEMVARNVLASAIAVLPVKSLSRFLQFCSSAVRPPLRATHLPACNAPPCVHRTSLRASHLPACIAPPCLHRTSLRASHLPACIAPPCLHRLSVPLYPFSLCASQGSLCHCIPRHSTSLHSPTQLTTLPFPPAPALPPNTLVQPPPPHPPFEQVVPHGGAGGGGGGAFLFISINLPTRFPFFSPPQFHMLAQVVGAEAHALAELQGFVLALLRAFTAANAISTAEADAIAAAAILEGGAVEDDVL
ncbi:unnamed protein product [Closterium sp. NIES-65]|nr:unnamed protein product [Closterium sp. NIES-65]